MNEIKFIFGGLVCLFRFGDYLHWQLNLSDHPSRLFRIHGVVKYNIVETFIIHISVIYKNKNETKDSSYHRYSMAPRLLRLSLLASSTHLSGPS